MKHLNDQFFGSHNTLLNCRGLTKSNKIGKSYISLIHLYYSRQHELYIFEMKHVHIHFHIDSLYKLYKFTFCFIDAAVF